MENVNAKMPWQFIAVDIDRISHPQMFADADVLSIFLLGRDTAKWVIIKRGIGVVPMPSAEFTRMKRSLEVA